MEDRRRPIRGRVAPPPPTDRGTHAVRTAAYSVGYVAGWVNGDTDAVADTARAVLATVHELADALDPTDTDTADTTDAAETAAA